MDRNKGFMNLFKVVLHAQICNNLQRHQNVFCQVLILSDKKIEYSLIYENARICKETHGENGLNVIKLNAE